MKRPHRRMHFMFWILAAPITALTGFVFWQSRPATPYSELPPGIEEISGSPTDASETP